MLHARFREPVWRRTSLPMGNIVPIQGNPGPTGTLRLRPQQLPDLETQPIRIAGFGEDTIEAGAARFFDSGRLRVS